MASTNPPLAWCKGKTKVSLPIGGPGIFVLCNTHWQLHSFLLALKEQLPVNLLKSKPIIAAWRNWTSRALCDPKSADACCFKSKKESVGVPKEWDPILAVGRCQGQNADSSAVGAAVTPPPPTDPVKYLSACVVQGGWVIWHLLVNNPFA